MTIFKLTRVWILGVSILAYGCSGSDGNEDLFQDGTGALKGGGGTSSGGGGLGLGGLGGLGQLGGDATKATTNKPSPNNGNKNSGTESPSANNDDLLGGGDAPTSGTNTSGGGESACSPEPGADACTSCLLRSCCTQASQCLGNESCSSLGRCASSCTDDSCIQDCAAADEAGVPAYKALLTCASNNCASVCGK